MALRQQIVEDGLCWPPHWLTFALCHSCASHSAPSNWERSRGGPERTASCSLPKLWPTAALSRAWGGSGRGQQAGGAREPAAAGPHHRAQRAAAHQPAPDKHSVRCLKQRGPGILQAAAAPRNCVTAESSSASNTASVLNRHCGAFLWQGLRQAGRGHATCASHSLNLGLALVYMSLANFDVSPVGCWHMGAGQACI